MVLFFWFKFCSVDIGMINLLQYKLIEGLNEVKMHQVVPGPDQL